MPSATAQTDFEGIIESEGAKDSYLRVALCAESKKDNPQRNRVRRLVRVGGGKWQLPVDRDEFESADDYVLRTNVQHGNVNGSIALKA